MQGCRSTFVHSYGSGDWVGLSVVGCSVGVSVGWLEGFAVGVLVGSKVGSADGTFVGIKVSMGAGVGLDVGYSVGIGALVCMHDILKLHEYFNVVLLHAQPYESQNAFFGGI